MREPRYSKWIGYEFASDLKAENVPFEFDKNEIVDGSVSGYLMDIISRPKRTSYLVEVRYLNKDYEHKTKVIPFAMSAFKKHFYDVTVLPR